MRRYSTETFGASVPHVGELAKTDLEAGARTPADGTMAVPENTGL
ncbi:hypothetical protein [Phyllobacterium myrsinacearum]|nr:hypothetical protein [Phyllobacterium myrsinacearum]